MLILTADQKVRLTASYTDRYGNPAPIDGLPRWEASADGFVTVTPAEDGMSAEVVTAGRIGTVQVRATADAASGAEERLIIGVLDIEVVGGEARVVTLTAGAAQAKDDDEETPPLAPAEEPDAPDEGAV
jgi:hypothetical protein